MVLKLYNKWTWTEWYGNFWKTEDIIIPTDFKGIKNLEQFKQQYFNSKTWKFINWSYTKVFKFLGDLEEQTWVDPIKYLYYLYYEQELSTIDIYNRFYELWWYNNKKKDTFEKMFKNTFWWTLRDNTDITKLWITRIVAHNKKLNKTSKDIKQQKQKDLYLILINKFNILKMPLQLNHINQDIVSFSVKPKLIWKNQLEKLNYFLEIYWFKDKNIRLKDYLFKYKESYWLKNLTDVVNKLLKEKWYDLKLSKWRFSELFRN